MRPSASLGISLVVAPVLALMALANFGTKGLTDNLGTYYFIGIPLLATIATIAAVRSERYKTVAVFFALLTFALAVYGLSLDAGSAVFAVPPACWTLAGLLTWPSPDPAGQASNDSES